MSMPREPLQPAGDSTWWCTTCPGVGQMTKRKKKKENPGEDEGLLKSGVQYE
jgi:hypothetical protein